MTEPREVGLREARAVLGELARAAADRDQITYLTSHGFRVAAVVPIRKTSSVAVAAELRQLADKFAGDEEQSYGGANDAYSAVVFELRERANTLEGAQ